MGFYFYVQQTFFTSPKKVITISTICMGTILNICNILERLKMVFQMVEVNSSMIQQQYSKGLGRMVRIMVKGPCVPHFLLDSRDEDTLEQTC